MPSIVYHQSNTDIGHNGESIQESVSSKLVCLIQTWHHKGCVSFIAICGAELVSVLHSALSSDSTHIGISEEDSSHQGAEKMWLSLVTCIQVVITVAVGHSVDRSLAGQIHVQGKYSQHMTDILTQLHE